MRRAAARPANAGASGVLARVTRAMARVARAVENTTMRLSEQRFPDRWRGWRQSPARIRAWARVPACVGAQTGRRAPARSRARVQTSPLSPLSQENRKSGGCGGEGVARVERVRQCWACATFDACVLAHACLRRGA